eukprot:12111525-Prorocentrum_lima.AAC.1
MAKQLADVVGSIHTHTLPEAPCPHKPVAVEFASNAHTMQQYVYHIPSKLSLEAVVGPMPDGDWGLVKQRVLEAEAVMHEA